MKNLFEEGMTLEQFKSIAFKEEKNLLENLKKNIIFDEEIISKIKNQKNLKILVAGESWCPYVRTFIATLEKAIEINENIKISIINFGRGLVFLADELGIAEEDFVVPTAVILDDNGEILKTYIGYPKIFEKNFSEVKQDFFNGKKSKNILEEILD